jgi:hypothetical protein
MFGQDGGMQISGANLLASQQLREAAPATKAPAPGFAAALQKAAGFTPRDLTAPQATAPAEAKTAAPAAYARPGAQIDIKV